MKKVARLLLLSFLAIYQFDTFAQSVDCSCKADSIQLFTLDKEEYNFSFTNMSQGLCFNNVIYESSPKIVVKIFNETQDTLINHYRERDAHIHWLRKNGRFDTIYPGQAMILQGITPGGKFIGSMNTSPIYLRYQIKDSVYNNKIYVCGNIYPTEKNPEVSFKDSIKQSSQKLTIEKDTAPKNGFYEILYPTNSKYLTEYWDNGKLLIKYEHPTKKIFVIETPYPKKFDTIPFVTEETYFGAPNDYEFTLSVDDRKISREIYVDGRVIERYNHGGIYSEIINKDSTSIKPFYTRYHRNGKIWFEYFENKKSIEYYATGELKWIRDDKFDKLYFRSGELKQISYIGVSKTDTSVRFRQYFKNGCKQFEIYGGNLSIIFDSTRCNCPIKGERINAVGELTYFNCSLDSAVRKSNYETYFDIGEFDLKGILKNGSRIYPTGQNLEKFVFFVSDSIYRQNFDFYTSFYATDNLLNADLIVPFEGFHKTAFNQLVDGKKEGPWIILDTNMNDFMKRFSYPNKEIPTNFIYRYPKNIYKNGTLVETHFFSELGTLIKKVKYLNSKKITENYTYEILGTPGDKQNLSYCTVLIYINDALAKIVSPRVKADYWSGDNNSRGVSSFSIPFHIQSGEFTDQKLLNGTIEYFDEKGYLVKTIIVKNGKENPANMR